MTTMTEPLATIPPPATAYSIYSLKPDNTKLNLIGWAPDASTAIMVACAVYQGRQGGHFDTHWVVAVYDNRTPPNMIATLGLASP